MENNEGSLVALVPRAAAVSGWCVQASPPGARAQALAVAARAAGQVAARNTGGEQRAVRAAGGEQRARGVGWDEGRALAVFAVLTDQALCSWGKRGEAGARSVGL